MKKDKEWLKEELVKLKKETDERNKYGSNYTDEQLVVRRMRDLADQLEEPEQDIDAVHDLLAKITTLSQEDFDLYWNCINDGVAVSDLKQEKLVVPQFVADRIEEYREIRFGLSLIFTIDDQTEDDIDFSKWLSADSENCEKVARAWLNGYTVEKEKLYRVKVDQGPNYLYVESLHLYSDVIKPLDFNYKFSAKEHALKFASRNQAKGVAELVGGEVEEVTE